MKLEVIRKKIAQGQHAVYECNEFDFTLFEKVTNVTFNVLFVEVVKIKGRNIK